MKKITVILLSVVLMTTAIHVVPAQNVSKAAKEEHKIATTETLLDIGQLTKDLGLGDFDFVMKIKSVSSKEQPTIYSSDLGFEQGYLDHNYELKYKTLKGEVKVLKFNFDGKGKPAIMTSREGPIGYTITLEIKKYPDYICVFGADTAVLYPGEGVWATNTKGEVFHIFSPEKGKVLFASQDDLEFAWSDPDVIYKKVPGPNLWIPFPGSKDVKEFDVYIP